MRDFLSWALSIGSVAGIRIRLHLILLVFWLFELDRHLAYDIARPRAFLYWGLTIGITGVLILLHELGHCFAARRVGGQADDVLLWPLGGLAYCSAPNLPYPQFFVAAGGPAVTLLIAIAANVGFAVAGRPEEFSPVYETARWTLVGFHNFLLVINLVPMYPLDGGRILQAALWAYFSRRGAGGSYGRASLVTVYVSRVCVVLWVLVAIVVYGSIMMGFIGVWSWLEAENLYRRIREGAGEDFTFGYDFSRGYTSLEGGSTTSRKRSGGGLLGWLKRWKRRVVAAREPTSEEKARVDELLNKISREGMPSLSGEERRFLRRMSKRWDRKE